jgi:histidinol-phosphate/aromatic aminotransferase/cobyric acid decarboxylase-like protein
LRTLLAALDRDCRIWIDETYVDFAAGAPTAEPLVRDDPRVVVAKSMSKFFALSGLRVGYLAADRALVAALEPWNPPWSAGLLAQVAAVRALGAHEWYREQTVRTHALREDLRRQVDAIAGLRCFPSTTNFLLFASQHVPSPTLVARCRQAGVYLRDCATLSPRFGTRFVRTAVKDGPANARIVAALAAAVRTG